MSRHAAKLVACRSCGYSVPDRHGRCPECGAEHDPAAPGGPRHPRLLATYHGALVVGFTLWSANLALLFRGQHFGPSPRALLGGLLLQLLLSLPMLAAMLIPYYVHHRRLRWPHFVGTLAVVLVSGTLLAEAWAGAQDLLFHQRCRNLPATAPRVFETRWWPCGTSHIAYDPATGRWWGGC